MCGDETPLTAEEIPASWMRTAQSFISNWCRRSQRSAIWHMLLSTKSYGDSVNSQTAGKSPFPFWDRMQHHTVDVSGGRAIEVDQGHDRNFDGAFATDKFNICRGRNVRPWKGKSKPLADEKGVHRLYIDYVLKELCEFLVAKGKADLIYLLIYQIQGSLPTWGYRRGREKAPYIIKSWFLVCSGAISSAHSRS